MRFLRLIVVGVAMCLAMPAVALHSAQPGFAAGTLSASYSTSGQPTSMTPGSSTTFRVTVTNTGTSSWPAGGSTPVHLGIHFASRGGGYGASGTDSTWATDQRFWLPYNVSPGQSITLTVTVTAPSTPLGYALEYQMVQENVAWFPQYLDSIVQVSNGGTLGAAYETGAEPAQFAPGTPATYSVTLTNSGSATWFAGGMTPTHLGVHFAARGGGYGVSGTEATWYTNQRFALPYNVAPGQSVTLSLTVATPSASGTYVLEYQAVEENVAWFPQYADKTVNVGSVGGTTCTNASTQQACINLMLSIVNHDRANAGLTPYSLNMTQSTGTSTCVGSYGHSVHMASVGYISHDQFPADICISYTTAGENVGMSQSGSESGDLQTIDNMMMSEPHDANTCATTVNHACNILSTKYHQIGIGIYYTGTTTWLTEDFTN